MDSQAKRELVNKIYKESQNNPHFTNMSPEEQQAYVAEEVIRNIKGKTYKNNEIVDITTRLNNQHKEIINHEKRRTRVLQPNNIGKAAFVETTLVLTILSLSGILGFILELLYLKIK